MLKIIFRKYTNEFSSRAMTSSLKKALADTSGNPPTHEHNFIAINPTAIGIPPTLPPMSKKYSILVKRI